MCSLLCAVTKKETCERDYRFHFYRFPLERCNVCILLSLIATLIFKEKIMDDRNIYKLESCNSKVVG